MSKISCGILLYRRAPDGMLEAFLVHPGGPFFARKDEGAWSIPKGEIDAGDTDELAAAVREFAEETGFRVDTAKAVPLRSVQIKSGKKIHAFAIEGHVDPAELRSNEFEIEWPPRSGKRKSFPEVDRAAWFSLEIARVKINPGQVPLLDQLIGLRVTDSEPAKSPE